MMNQSGLTAFQKRQLTKTMQGEFDRLSSSSSLLLALLLLLLLLLPVAE